MTIIIEKEPIMPKMDLSSCTISGIAASSTLAIYECSRVNICCTAEGEYHYLFVMWKGLQGDEDKTLIIRGTKLDIIELYNEIINNDKIIVGNRKNIKFVLSDGLPAKEELLKIFKQEHKTE